MPDELTPVQVGSGDVTEMTTPVEGDRSPFDTI
jgi:hypothetical protein